MSIRYHQVLFHTATNSCDNGPCNQLEHVLCIRFRIWKLNFQFRPVQLSLGSENRIAHLSLPSSLEEPSMGGKVIESVNFLEKYHSSISS